MPCGLWSLRSASRAYCQRYSEYVLSLQLRSCFLFKNVLLCRPEDIPKCPEDVSQAGDCIVKIINQLIPRVKHGVPELHIPAYDPFVLDRLNFQYASGNVKGRFSVRDLKIYGFANQEMKKAEVQVKGDKVKLKLLSHVPHMNLQGEYKGELTVNALQLKPKGKFNITISE